METRKDYLQSSVGNRLCTPNFLRLLTRGDGTGLKKWFGMEISERPVVV